MPLQMHGRRLFCFAEAWEWALPALSEAEWASSRRFGNFEMTNVEGYAFSALLTTRSAPCTRDRHLQRLGSSVGRAVD
jgi:hypothetical protein